MTNRALRLSADAHPAAPERRGNRRARQTGELPAPVSFARVLAAKEGGPCWLHATLAQILRVLPRKSFSSRRGYGNNRDARETTPSRSRLQEILINCLGLKCKAGGPRWLRAPQTSLK